VVTGTAPNDLEVFLSESINTFDRFATLLYQQQNIKAFNSDTLDAITFWDKSNGNSSEQEKLLAQLEENI
jgi:hypothetical protein